MKDIWILNNYKFLFLIANQVAASSAAREQAKYGIAGGIAEEVLTSIRTIAAFGGQAREIER